MTNDAAEEELIEKITRQVIEQFGGACGHRFTENENPCAAAGEGVGCLSESSKAVDRILEQGACRISSGCRPSSIRKDLASLIDHTLLKPNATKEDIEGLCREALQFEFCSVCVNPAFVQCCAEMLAGSGVKVCTVVGFPLGANTPEIKAWEASIAKKDGATEIDMVINIGALRGGAREYCLQDIRGVVEAAHPEALVKVILETAQLTDSEIVEGCLLAREAGADFVKTSTGFSTGGADAADIALMRRVVGPDMGVKASGGVGDAKRADLMVQAGASRIGASASVEVVRGGGDS